MLSDRKRWVLERWVNGETLGEIGFDLAVTRQMVAIIKDQACRELGIQLLEYPFVGHEGPTGSFRYERIPIADVKDALRKVL